MLFDCKPVLQGSAKILVVSSLTEIASANYLIRALRGRGHTLLVYSDVRSDLADVVGTGIVDAAGLSEKKQFDPDLLLFIEGGTMQMLPVGLEKLRCLTAWYGIDTHMDYGKHLRIGRLFDVTFVAQKQYVERLRADGLRQAYWLPLAFAPEIAPEGALERKYELAYVGSDDPQMHPKRHALLTAIKQKVAPVFVGKASPREMMRIYSQAKMVFNKSVNNDINMRYFEAMGAGAVLLTDRVRGNGVKELFRPGEHFIEYEDAKSLLHAVERLRHDAEACRKIGEAARTHILARHTYGHRVQALLETVGAAQKLAAPAADGYLAAFAALDMPHGVLIATADVLCGMGGSSMRRRLNRVLSFCMRALGFIVGDIHRFWLRSLARQ